MTKPRPRRSDEFFGPRPIGYVSESGGFHLVECADCSWRIRKRDRADAASLLKSHARIAHPTATPIYAED